jgi:hypothetical protein
MRRAFLDPWELLPTSIAFNSVVLKGVLDCCKVRLGNSDADRV